MSANSHKTTSGRVNYSKFLSSLFSSLSIVALSILCLLNNPTLDLYTSFCILKVVIPASFCAWFMGTIIGKKFDNCTTTVAIKKELASSDKAYEIPSMFSSPEATEENNESAMEIF